VKGLGQDGRYWEALSQGRLELPRCAACGRWRWPAPFRCGDCGSWRFDWQAVEMRGVIYSWTRTWHPFEGTESFGSPFVTLSVALPDAGDIRLMGVLDGEGEPVIGAPVVGHVAEAEVYGRTIPGLRWAVTA
jgi:uncharacterized OB-fold protein